MRTWSRHDTTVESVIKKAKADRHNNRTAVDVLEEMLESKWLSDDKRILLETALWMLQPLMMKTATSSRGPRNKNGPDLALSALTFYMCWRFRKNENPSFQSLNKDMALMICSFVRRK
jgi:hypothetical protein